MIYRKKQSMKVDRKYLVIMNNVFRDIKIGNRFDLKGSTAGRVSLHSIEEFEDQSRDVKKILKDIDFDKNVGNIKLEKKQGKKTLEEILEQDSHFLGSVDIIDYSVLLGEVVDNDYIS
eukprot:CAMPEP_0202980236 /NCGR_PEP_ID=MMETSP1396-20130829/86192_1 /ASSEMBLY_ACC=CAM_ASM_000872 /TAXON_ID= /ORGANISM="Pseudokeronopsis sp., Strain Brazil" /LENGTH=117 /DNA_ID=CAMNT_0049720073 /DNA_START=1630 /DNA_END=1983 /DNA_ORIENTATION=-